MGVSPVGTKEFRQEVELRENLRHLHQKKATFKFWNDY